MEAQAATGGDSSVSQVDSGGSSGYTSSDVMSCELPAGVKGDILTVVAYYTVRLPVRSAR